MSIFKAMDNVVEFYDGSLDNIICRRSGILNVPRSGDTFALGSDMYTVVCVSWNMDYMNMDHEQWRCNVIATKYEGQ